MRARKNSRKKKRNKVSLTSVKHKCWKLAAYDRRQKSGLCSYLTHRISTKQTFSADNATPRRFNFISFECSCFWIRLSHDAHHHVQWLFFNYCFSKSFVSRNFFFVCSQQFFCQFLLRLAHLANESPARN